MAELVLSGLLPVLLDKLASAALKSIARYKGIDADMIKKWQRSLKQIQSVLADASRKEITNDSVKRWLNDLQHLAYDIDDVLDDLAYEAIDRDFNRESEAITITITITSKVKKLIPTCCTNFSSSTSIHDKLDGITAKLRDLVEERDVLGLRVEEETRPRNNNNNNNRRLQTSVVQPSSIIGRKEEKEAFIHELLSVEPYDQNFSIVPIVGMGGVGKTTLARLLYDEKEVKDHFQLKAWVCVSDEFNSFAISKVIFQSVTGLNKEFVDLNLLQEELRTHLREKMFLLVLDDVWSESYEDWETLAGPFHACAPGSKIIITTRKRELIEKLGYNPLNKQLEKLSNEDALSLVALNALDVDNFDSHLSLKPYAEGIVKKCGGLPLALITLGRLLRTKRNDVEHWKYVLNSEIWSLKDGAGILPALRLSYHDLSAPLKQLFAYCSLFPKDFLFDKEELVLLWMAEGLLHWSTPSHSTKERLGHEYFDELLSRSFFQLAPYSESLFVMHDLLNDLATYVAGEFFVRLDNETKNNIREEMLEKYRHISVVCEKFVAYKKVEAFKRAKSLRTFLATYVGVVKSRQSFYLSNNVLVDLLPDLPLLRVLHLSNFEISELPESIGTLRHLRYLNLSNTKITHLPESMCNLYNLQTLILLGCHELTTLPNSFLKLKNLRHLDLRHTLVLHEMPLGIGELKSLQTLSKIIIGGKSGFDISKLGDFKNLCGKVSIEGLDKVGNATQAHDAQLSQKRFSELELVWSDELHGSQNGILEKDVLNELKPCNERLKQLEIVSYGGLEFPNWVGDPSFLHLEHVSVRSCKRCTSLPPLGQLRLLKELFIDGLHGVEVVGLELLGTGAAFPSLEILSFRDMRGWKKWSANTTEVFPRLEQLLLKDCPNLVEVTLEGLPSLNDLQIYLCPNLVEVSLGAIPSLDTLNMSKCDGAVLRRLVEEASSVTELTINDISGLNDMVWRDVIGHLKCVEDLSICCCNELTYLWESEAFASKVLVKLKELRVYYCDNLVSLGEREEEDNCRGSLLTTLRMLNLSGCKNMKRCCCPDSIETLSVLDCDSITAISLPTGGQKLKSLEIFGCNSLLEREWGGQKMNNNISSRSSNVPMLERVDILSWPNLKSIIELSYLVHLTVLSIRDCENLESFPDNELPNLTSLKHLHIINCPSMDDCFPRGFWPPKLQSLEIGRLKKPISEWGPQNFPTSLLDLRLIGGGEDGVSSCNQISHLLPSSLTFLHIEKFEKLESLNSMGLQHLQHLFFFSCPNLNKLLHSQHHTSLQQLSFSCCPNMTDLPEELLPSLLSLYIRGDCPKLKERCSEKGCYWPLISHIPCIYIP